MGISQADDEDDDFDNFVEEERVTVRCWDWRSQQACAICALSQSGDMLGEHIQPVVIRVRNA
jgi:hypothetical protein